MSCDTHDWICPNFLAKEYSNQLSKRYEKYFLIYTADNLAHDDTSASATG